MAKAKVSAEVLGHVSRDVVLRAIRACRPPHAPRRLTISERSGNAPNCWFVTISDGNKKHMVMYIPPETCRRTINEIARHFNVPKV